MIVGLLASFNSAPCASDPTIVYLAGPWGLFQALSLHYNQTEAFTQPTLAGCELMQQAARCAVPTI